MKYHISHIMYDTSGPTGALRGPMGALRGPYINKCISTSEKERVSAQSDADHSAINFILYYLRRARNTPIFLICFILVYNILMDVGWWCVSTRVNS